MPAGDSVDEGEEEPEAAVPGEKEQLQAAGLIEGVEEGSGAGQPGRSEPGSDAAQTKALEERDRDARPPWFSQRALFATPGRKDASFGWVPPCFLESSSQQHRCSAYPAAHGAHLYMHSCAPSRSAGG